MCIKVEIELRRPSRRSVALLLGLLLLAVPAVTLASHQFPDVPTSSPFHSDIDWVADYGILNGYSDGMFRPTEPVTRQALAAALHRLSNQFKVVSKTTDPANGNSYESTAACPDDKRAIAGGGKAIAGNIFVTKSHPSEAGWTVRWESENDRQINPTSMTVYALCAPRL
jgi:S-layer family protein